jgi:hypothetical protein
VTSAPPPLHRVVRFIATPKGALTLLSSLLIVGGAIFLINTAATWPGALSAVPDDATVSVRLQSHIHTGLWFGTLTFVLVLLAALLSARWWLRPNPAVPAGWLERTDHPPLVSRNIVLLALLVATALGAWMRLPRMEVGLYFDELHSMRNYAIGKQQQKENHVLHFRKAKWKETFWLDRESNNHVMYSIAARLSLDLWKKLGLREEGRVSETAARVPSLIAGLATVFLVGWFLYRLGFPTAGIIAAFALALHPWHIRYSAEARGYAMCMFFAVLMLFFLVRALRSGQWRDWMGYAFAQFATLYCYAGAVYVPVAVNGVTFAGLLLLTRKQNDYPAREQAIRLLVACFASAIVFVQLMAPCIIQLAEFIQRPYVRAHAPRSGWLPDFWAYLSTGMPWKKSDPSNPLHFAVSTGGAILGIFAAVLWPLSAIAGTIRLSRHLRFGTVLALAMILPAPLGYLHAQLAKNTLHIWYLIFALPAAIMLISLGLTYFGELFLGITGQRRRRVAGIVGAAYLALFAWLTHDQRETIRHNSKEPAKLVVDAIYGNTDPFSPEADEIITAGVWSDATFYDPWLQHVFEPEHFFTVMERSLDENRPLFYTHGHLETARRDVPAAFAFLDNPKLFRHIKKFWGLEEPQFNHHLLEFIGDRAAVDEMKNNPVASPSPQP